MFCTVQPTAQQKMEVQAETLHRKTPNAVQAERTAAKNARREAVGPNGSSLKGFSSTSATRAPSATRLLAAKSSRRVRCARQNQLASPTCREEKSAP